MKILRLTALLALAAALSGCNMDVLFPTGHVAMQQRDLIVLSTLLMLIIIVPVMVVTVLFAWRYRAGNKDAPYDPDWDHSTSLELLIWGAPLLIIICLGALTWMGTHLLDPYRPLSAIDSDRRVEDSVQPMDVQVVALNWKWLFIYPEYGVASVNELAAPVDRPIRFSITATNVMNAFSIPSLAGMIYAMPGMETKLHAVSNVPGTYRGFSANYSGDGFSEMRFPFKSLEPAAFDAWIAAARNAPGRLDSAGFLELRRDSVREPVRFYNGVEDMLWRKIVEMCVEPGRMCSSERMMVDARGGLEAGSVYNTLAAQFDPYALPGGALLDNGASYIASICSEEEAAAAATAAAIAADRSPPLPGTDKLRGLDLPVKQSLRFQDFFAPARNPSATASLRLPSDS